MRDVTEGKAWLAWRVRERPPRKCMHAASKNRLHKMYPRVSVMELCADSDNQVSHPISTVGSKRCNDYTVINWLTSTDWIPSMDSECFRIDDITTLALDSTYRYGTVQPVLSALTAVHSNSTIMKTFKRPIWPEADWSLAPFCYPTLATLISICWMNARIL